MSGSSRREAASVQQARRFWPLVGLLAVLAFIGHASLISDEVHAAPSPDRGPAVVETATTQFRGVGYPRGRTSRVGDRLVVDRPLEAERGPGAPDRDDDCAVGGPLAPPAGGRDGLAVADSVGVNGVPSVPRVAPFPARGAVGPTLPPGVRRALLQVFLV